MNVSNMISDAVLAGTAGWVFWRNFQWMSRYSQMVWALFLLPIAITALAGVLRFGGVRAMIPLHHSLEVLAGSLGVISVVVGVWNLTLRKAVSPASFWATTTLGLILFFAMLLSPPVGNFAPVIRSLGMLMVMLIACYGLFRRNKSAVWIVFAVMILALAAKFGNAPTLPFDPTDFYHYTLALALLCFGRAAHAARTNQER